MVGASLSLISFIFLYFLIAYGERTKQRISAGRFALVMAIPFICSILMGFSSGILGSAALAGWLAVLTRFILTYVALWKFIRLPGIRSFGYTAAAVIFNIILQSIWFYGLANSATPPS